MKTCVTLFLNVYRPLLLPAKLIKKITPPLYPFNSVPQRSVENFNLIVFRLSFQVCPVVLSLGSKKVTAYHAA